MTSKEALEELYKEREYLLGEKVNNKTKNWHNDITHYDNINHCLLTIKQDLDRLEELRDSYEIATSKLKMAIEIILKYKINPSTFIFTRKIYKESCGKDLTFEKAHSLLEFNGTQEEYNLLKGVLEE